MTTPLRIIALGHAVLDRIYELDVLPAGPGKFRARVYREGGGGMAATAAVAVAALGGRAAWWGRVGSDAAGQQLRGILATKGVEMPAMVMIEGGTTATATSSVTPDGERSSITYPGDLASTTDWLPLHEVDEAGAVLVDHCWPEGAACLLAAAEARGLPRILDADLGAPEVVRQLVPLVDHAVFSRSALAEFTSISDPAGGLHALLGYGTKVVGVTLGAAGSLWLVAGQLHHVPTVTIAGPDITGCGDVFHGAYALALAEGASLIEAARFATAAAALNAVSGRSWDGMPDRAAVMNVLKGNWS